MTMVSFRFLPKTSIFLLPPCSLPWLSAWLNGSWVFLNLYFWKHPLPGKDTKNFLAFSPAALRVQYLFSDAPLKTKPILQKFFGCPFCFQKYTFVNSTKSRFPGWEAAFSWGGFQLSFSRKTMALPGYDKDNRSLRLRPVRNFF